MRRLLLACLAIVPGCGVSVRYRSNREILDAVANGLGFSVDGEEFRLYQTQVREDAVLLSYAGVRYAGEQAWVWRFSPKSTEQNPGALTDVEALLPTIAEGRRGFAPAEPVVTVRGDGTLRTVAYRFESPTHDAQGRPFTARGIVGIFETPVGDDVVIYYFNLDNWGSRTEVGVAAVEPFLRAMSGVTQS